MTRVACVAIAAVLLLLAWQGARLAWPRGELRDYGSFIASGRAAAEGLNPYGIYPLTFHVVIGRIDLHNPNLNPPLSVLPLQVLGRLDPVSSFAGWWIFSLACYVVAVALLARRYGAGAGGLLVPWALALAGFWDTLVLGQIYLPLVLCAVCAWLLLDRGRTVAAGLLIGVVVAMKPNFATWPAILLLAGHRRAALSAVASACALSLLPLLAHGAEIYRQWFALIASDGARGAFVTNASLWGLARRIDAAWAGALASVVTLAVLALLAWNRAPDVRRASAAGIAAAILASPIAWVHYTLFLLPVFFSRRRSTTLMIAGALLVLPVPLVLRFLDAPAWQQVSIGSIYGWAVVLVFADVLAWNLSTECNLVNVEPEAAEPRRTLPNRARA